MVVQWNLDNLKQYSQDSSARETVKRMKRRGCFASIWLLQMSLTTMRLNTVATYDLIWQQASSNEPLTDFKVQDYERLERELVAAKEAGRSYEDLESTNRCYIAYLA